MTWRGALYDSDRRMIRDLGLLAERAYVVSQPAGFTITDPRGAVIEPLNSDVKWVASAPVDCDHLTLEPASGNTLVYWPAQE